MKKDPRRSGNSGREQVETIIHHYYNTKECKSQ